MLYIYFISIFVLAILGLLKHSNKLNEKVIFRIILIYVLFITCFRNTGTVGGDEYNYRLDSLGYIGEEFEWNMLLKAEGGNYLLQWSLANIFKYTQPYIFVTAAITNILIIYSIKRYSDNFLMSMFLYVTQGALASSMNISRQYVAIGIIYFAYRFVEERNFVKYSILILLAYWFHTSAIVMLPMYFILGQKKFSKWSILLFIGAIIAMINFEKIATILVQGTAYDHYISSFDENNGMNPIRMLTTVLPGILIFMLKTKSDKINAKPQMLYNALLMMMMISVVSIAFKYAYRFGGYFSLGGYILIPNILKILDKKTKIIAIISIVSMYMLFGYIEHNGNVEYHNIAIEHNLQYGTTYGAKYIR